MRRSLSLTVVAAILVALQLSPPVPACCPVPPSGKPVVNADQTVVIVWDAAAKMQHFIRKASFKSDAADFAFLIPTPSQPELNESGNEAFPFLQKLTAPETVKTQRPRGMNCGCGEVLDKAAAPANAVRVLEEKLVAGFNAVVLEADSAGALVSWLEEHGYAFSPEVQDWAAPYVESGWKITALKVAKDDSGTEDKAVSASALRMSFETDRPLFPYREPDTTEAARALGATDRLLRIYFIADARYQGELGPDQDWSGKVVWADKLSSADREKLLDVLEMPQDAAPADCWLTEFEDHWAYRRAPADLRFAQSDNQGTVKRAPIVEYVAADSSPDVMACTLVAIVLGAPFVSRSVYRKRRDQV